MSQEHDVVIGGPLAEYADGYRCELKRLGYKDDQAGKRMIVVAEMSAWMQRGGIGTAELSAVLLEEFFDERRRRGHRWLVTTRSAAGLLAWLRDAGALGQAETPAPLGSVEALVERYRAYLVRQRGLAPGTIAGYERAARLFCVAISTEVEALGSLTAADVSEFVSQACARPVKVSPRELVSELRSFLRFLYAEGVIAAPLAQAVPSYASWRGAGLPKALASGQLSRLLASCDRRTTAGRRDYAVLVLLARLGLRSGEVAALCLDDLDWRAGELVVHGKGRREERLPLPADVGEALAGYLHRGRPSVDTRAVFVRMQAPLVGLSPTGVTWVVYNACDRVGLARVGAHRLRHSAATAVLGAGGSLTEVGQLLRHRRVATTAIYAKVDQLTLGDLARPWPGSAA
jgi:integrase/recombinase XerD